MFLSLLFFYNIEIFKFIIWISVGLTGYFLGNLYIKIKCHLSCLCSYCLVSDNNDYFHLDFNRKTNMKKEQDLTSFILYSLIFCVFLP